MKKISMALIVGTLVLGLSGVVLAEVLITFDEFPVGTPISNQYLPQGVEFFGGSITPGLPVIDRNGAMPDQPILRPAGAEAGYYTYNGDFYMRFTQHADYVEFQSGYWDQIGSGYIQLWDASLAHTLIASNTITGPETMAFNPTWDIKWIYFKSFDDPAGADIDNLKFRVPEPGTLLLLGFGLIGLAGLRRKLRK